MMPWSLTHRCDSTTRAIADRHYNRQSDCVNCGAPIKKCACGTYQGSENFAPPGRSLVLRHARAFWITSWPFAEYVNHDWPGAWVCSAFRLEGGDAHEASALILSALAVTRWALSGDNPEIESWRGLPVPKVDAWKIHRRPNDHDNISPIRVCMVTMVDPTKTTRKRDPGRCFRRAGFVEIGQTRQRGLVVLGLPVDALPLAEAPIGAQRSLFASGW